MTTNPPTPPPKSDVPDLLLRPSLHLNWEDWLPYLEDETAPLDAKRQLIETVWSIAMAFADLGWDIAPPETCGQATDLTAWIRQAVLDSERDYYTESEEV